MKSSVQKILQMQSQEWEKYSRYQEIRLWKAALLTLGVAPTTKARLLLLQDEDAAKSFRERKSEMRNALAEKFSPDKVLWLNHLNNGQRISEGMVSLPSVVAFAKTRKWSIPDEMQNLWGALTDNVPKRASAEENKNTSLKKILAAVIFSVANGNSSQGFREVASKLENKLDNAGLKMDRETLNDHVEAAIEYLQEHTELMKQLKRPRNEKHS